MSGDCRPARFKCHEKDAADERSCHTSSGIYLYCRIYFGSGGCVRCGLLLSENNKSSHSWASSVLLLNSTLVSHNNNLKWIWLFFTNLISRASNLLYFTLLSCFTSYKNKQFLERISLWCHKQVWCPSMARWRHKPAFSRSAHSLGVFFCLCNSFGPTECRKVEAASSQVTSTGAIKIWRQEPRGASCVGGNKWVNSEGQLSASQSERKHLVPIFWDVYFFNSPLRFSSLHGLRLHSDVFPFCENSLKVTVVSWLIIYGNQ